MFKVQGFGSLGFRCLRFSALGFRAVLTPRVDVRK